MREEGEKRGVCGVQVQEGKETRRAFDASPRLSAHLPSATTTPPSFLSTVTSLYNIVHANNMQVDIQKLKSGEVNLGVCLMLLRLEYHYLYDRNA